MTPVDILSRYWGYDKFRPMQEEIIESVLAGHDTIGLLPTGGGKSITFQVPAMLLPGLTLVVTPLISLMKDQADNLKAVGIPATILHAGLTHREKELAMTRCRLGKVKIVYLSPERLQNRSFLAEMRGVDVSLIVVDEAHCFSLWGYDFRPNYLKVAALRSLVGEHVPVLALTASATPEVVADIADKLQMRGHRLFARSFDRDNLSYIVRYSDTKEQTLGRVLASTDGTAIVYVRSRRRTVELAASLSASGFSAEAYHAGLDPDTKTERQDRWKSGETRIIVATNAFGMGIDKPDVRLVVHVDLPSSLEEYYQEAGRAGRDGLPSMAVAIVNNRDKATLTRRLNDAFPDKSFIADVYEKLCVFLGVAVGDGYDRVFEFPFETFVHRFKLPPVTTDSALRLLTRAGWIDFDPEPSAEARVMLRMNREELYGLSLPPVAEEVLEAILRRYTGLFADYVGISEQRLGIVCGISTQQVYEALLLLGRMKVLSYVPRSASSIVYFPTSREDTRHIVMPLEVYDRQRERMERRLEAVRNFAFSSTECRSTTLLRYFGETPEAPCGKCDVCRQRRGTDGTQRDDAPLEAAILATLAYGPRTLSSLTALISGRTPAAIAESVRRLAAASRLTLSPPAVDPLLSLPEA